MALHTLTRVILTTTNWLRMLYDVHLQEGQTEVERGGNIATGLRLQRTVWLGLTEDNLAVMASSPSPI